jgi:hypothetical protein
LRNHIATQALERAVLPLFAFGLMREHRAEQLNLQHEIGKHEKMIAALCKGQPEIAATALGKIAVESVSHLRIEAQSKNSKSTVAQHGR